MGLSSLTEIYIKLRAYAGLPLSGNPTKQLVRDSAITSAAVTLFSMSVLLQTSCLMNPLAVIAASLALGGLLGIPLLYITLYLRGVERGRRVEKEFKYLIISNSLAFGRNTNIIQDLSEMSGSWRELFPALSREGRIISQLSRIMSLRDVVRTYVSWIRSRFVKTLLNDYIFSMSLGVQDVWVRRKGDEIVEELKNESTTKIKARIMLGMVIAVVLGYVPPLAAALSLLMGGGIIPTVAAVTIMVAAAAIASIPRYPHHLRMHTRRGLTRALSLVVLGISTLLFITGSLPRTSLLIGGFTLAMIGVLEARGYASIFVEASELSKLLTMLGEAPLEMSNVFNILKEYLQKSGLSSFRRLGSELTLLHTPPSISMMRLWITRFSIYTLLKGVKEGTLTREMLLKLSDLVNEALKDIKASLLSGLVITSMALFLPFLLNYIKAVGGVMSVPEAYIVTASVIYSVYSSAVIFDDPLNPLIPGVVLIELWLTG